MQSVFVSASFLCAACFGANAFASSELSQIIRCHDSIRDLGSGHTIKLSSDKPTPYVLSAGGKLYFVTADSIATTENKFKDQTVIFKLHENNRELLQKINFNKDGSFGMVSFEDIKSAPSTVEPHTALDKNSLDALKQDLAVTLKTISDEYPGRVDIPKRLARLAECNEVTSLEVQKNLAEQKARFEKRGAGKSSSTKKSGAR